MAMIEGNVTGLTHEQAEFAVSQVVKWMHTCEDNKRGHSAVDASHSALLRRLLLGMQFHEYPPPTSMSYPNYDMLEKDTIQLFALHEWDGRVVVDQNGKDWEWEDREKQIIRYKPTGLRFEVFDGTAYPVWVRDGDPKDHPRPAKFLRRLGLQYCLKWYTGEESGKQYGLISHAVRDVRYGDKKVRDVYGLWDRLGEKWVVQSPDEWQKLFEEEDASWKPTSSK